MKVKMCDVCYQESKKYVKSKWRLSIKKHAPEERLAIDACENHKAFFKGLNFAQAKEKTLGMYL